MLVSNACLLWRAVVHCRLIAKHRLMIVLTLSLTLSGTTAIESMGGPVLGFCAGRIDDVDGSGERHVGFS